MWRFLDKTFQQSAVKMSRCFIFKLDIYPKHVSHDEKPSPGDKRERN